MSWIIATGLVSGGLAATGSAALFLAAWMAMRLRGYRSARGEKLAGDPCQGAFLPSTYDFISLLSDEDFSFLASLPGYKPAIGKKLRRDHERILRLYLRELAREFHRVHAEAREIVANSGEEHAPVVGLLMRQQLAFWKAMAQIELSLVVPHFRAGRGNKVPVGALSGVIEAIAAMRAALEQRTAPAL